MEKKQIRYIDAVMRAVNDEKMEVEGYALKFDKPTEINEYGYKFIEKIDRNAMDEADLSDVVLTFNHSFDNLLAATRNSTLDLIIDDIGLKIRARLADTSTARDVYKMIKDGLIIKMSFIAMVTARQWEDSTKEDELDTRTIMKFGRFFDVSAVTFPAYEDTSISARSKEEVDEDVKRHFEAKGGKIMPKNENKKVEETVVETTVETTTDTAQNENDGVERAQPINVNVNVETATPIERQASDLAAISGVSADEVAQRAKTTEKEGIYATRGYLEAYMQSVREGSSDVAKRFISTNDSGDSKGGNVVVPTILEETVETAVRTGGSISSLCKITSIKAITSIPVELETEDAHEHEEGSPAPDEEDITLGEVLIKPKMLKKWLRITDEMEAMAIDEFTDYVLDEIVDKILVLLDRKIIANPQSASGGVQGIITNTNALFYNSITQNLTFATGYSGMALLDNGVESNVVVVMNRLTYFNNVMQLADTSGKPIYQVLQDATGKPQYYYAGMPVKFSDALPAYDAAAVDAVYMLVADFSGYRLNFPSGFGVSILRDPYSQSEADLVKYIGKLFVGGNITKIKRFVGIKKGA